MNTCPILEISKWLFVFHWNSIFVKSLNRDSWNDFILFCMYKLGGSKMDFFNSVSNHFIRNPILPSHKELDKNIKLCRLCLTINNKIYKTPSSTWLEIYFSIIIFLYKIDINIDRRNPVISNNETVNIMNRIKWRGSYQN